MEDQRCCSFYFEDEWAEEKEFKMNVWEWCNLELWDLD